MYKQLPNFDLAQNKPVLRHILNRRDCRLWKDKPVDKKIIEEILYAASWAPNHKMTEPWQFTVIMPSGREKFLNILAQGLIGTASNESEISGLQKKAAQIVSEFSSVPVFIAVACMRDPDPTTERENLLAVGCACQNMLLIAEENGLSAHWGSGLASKTNRLLQFLGWDSHIPVGLFQIGYAAEKPQTRRKPIEDFIHWVE